MESFSGSSNLGALPKTRPKSMILSSPSVSHTPGSIFPDIPSRHSFARPTTPPENKPDFARRQTFYQGPASPRRDPRPLRSSPLAGPSLALDSDGLLSPGSDESGSSESGEDRRRYRPSRISSTPDVPSMLTVFDSAVSPGGGPLSSRNDTSVSSISISPPPTSGSQSPVELPAEPEPSKQSNRLSWGLTKLTSLSSMPSRSPSILSRSSSKSSTKSAQSQKTEPVPPVPEIPIWALPSHTRSHPSSSLNVPRTAARSHPTLAPNGYTHMRRPATAPNPSTSASVNRRSSHFGAPSTSRDPELNWLSQAAPPKFSRLSLKAEGVIMPVSAKEANKTANRRSTVISPVSPSYAGGGNGRAREARTSSPGPSRTPSRSSMVSFGSAHSSRSQSFVATPPSPPFRSGSHSGSYSSIESTLSLTPPSTPGLTVSPSPSVISEDEVDEFGTLGQNECGDRKGKDEGEKGMVLELRVNDVHVEVMGGGPRALTKGMAEAAVGARDTRGGSTATITIPKEAQTSASPAAQKAQEGAKLQRGKGTLKRAWKCVINAVRG